jgi:hypothetical protein
MPDLMVQIDDQTVPLTRCKWVLLDPAGCAFSSSTGDSFVDAEQAHKPWKPRQRDRDRQIRQGWTVQLVTNDAWSTDIAPCFYGTCEHRTGGAA